MRKRIFYGQADWLEKVIILVTYAFRHSRGDATDLQDTAWKSDHFFVTDKQTLFLTQGGIEPTF